MIIIMYLVILFHIKHYVNRFLLYLRKKKKNIKSEKRKTLYWINIRELNKVPNIECLSYIC